MKNNSDKYKDVNYLICIDIAYEAAANRLHRGLRPRCGGGRGGRKRNDTAISSAERFRHFIPAQDGSINNKHVGNSQRIYDGNTFSYNSREKDIDEICLTILESVVYRSTFFITFILFIYISPSTNMPVLLIAE
jgi:hypothetical protein